MAAPNEVDECAECAERELDCKCALFSSVVPDRNRSLIHQHGGRPNISTNFEMMLHEFSGVSSAKPDHRALMLAQMLFACPPLATAKERKLLKKPILDENGEVCGFHEVWSKEEDPDGCETITVGNDIVSLFQAVQSLVAGAQAAGSVPPLIILSGEPGSGDAENPLCPFPAYCGVEEADFLGNPSEHPLWNKLTPEQQCAVVDPFAVKRGEVPPFELPKVLVPKYEWVEQFVYRDLTDPANIPDPADCKPGQILVNLVNGQPPCNFAICAKLRVEDDEGNSTNEHEWVLAECPTKGVQYNEASFPGGNPNGQPCGDGVNEGDYLTKFDDEGTKVGIIGVCLNGSWCVFPGWEALCVPPEPPVIVPTTFDGEPKSEPLEGPVFFDGVEYGGSEDPALLDAVRTKYGCPDVTLGDGCNWTFPPGCGTPPPVIALTGEVSELKCAQVFFGDDPDTAGENVDFIGTGLTLQPGYNATHPDGNNETMPRLTMKCEVPDDCNVLEFCFEINETSGLLPAAPFQPEYSVGIIASATGGVPGDTPIAGTHIGVAPVGRAWFAGPGTQCVSYAVTPGGTFEFFISIGNDPAQDQNTPNSLTNGTLECT